MAFLSILTFTPNHVIIGAKLIPISFVRNVSSAMESIDIEGVEVLFPYKPYDLQLDYMKALIQCLQNKTNGLLESPTGTGKTLCILCSTLGWLNTTHMNNMKQLLNDKIGSKNQKMSSTAKISLNGWQIGGTDSPQILYSSRTHQQLSQACRELKRTAYNNYKAVVIGSRDQLCLNPDVTKLETISAKNQMCRHKVSNNSCSYYRNYENKIERSEDYNSTQVFDIEDLMKFGRKNTCCPYYASRYIRSKSSLVFTPYNYILDPLIRNNNSLDLKNSVVIFDEGHNIEKICEESVSLELRSETFAVCIKNIDSILQCLKDIKEGTYDGSDTKELSELKIESVARLKLMVCDLEMTIDSMIKEKNSMKSLHETKAIFDIINRIGLDAISCAQWLDLMDKIPLILTNGNTLNASQATVVSSSFMALTQFIEKLVPIKISTTKDYEDYKLDFIKKFKIFSERGGNDREDDKKNFWNKKSDPNSWVLNIWCLSPSVGTKALLELGIHSMIITSGTLAPINSFEIEMDLNFPIKLQNSHIIKENQLSILNISNARDGTVLTSKYDNRDNLQYYRALGQTLIELMSVVPKGILVFFSSYTALNKCIEIWKQNDRNFWSKLNGIKQIFLEPRNKQTFNDCITKYKLKIDEIDSNGAAFFGVCRGKLSEGIDLPDDYCRCVIMTGLPFPSIADPRVVLKKQYLNESKTKLSADGWYTLQMKRALNQSIGRVVRHKNDFGVILLLDSRFATLNDGLSKWVEKFIFRKRINNLDQSIDKLKNFFSKNNFESNSNNFDEKNSSETKVSNEKFSKQNSIQSFIRTPEGLITNGFVDETTLFKEFKPIENFKSMQNNSQSIFDTINSSFTNKETPKELKTKSVPNNEETPLKRKCDLPFQPITDSKLEIENTKLHSIIKNKTISESNSAKKVRWSEENNRIHEFKPISLNFNETNEDNEESKPIIKRSQNPNEDVLQFWRNCGAKELFKGSKKFDELCQSIKTYKKYKNLRLLAKSFADIFQVYDENTRNHFIRELSTIVPKSDYHSFLKLCGIKLTAEELTDTKELIK